MQNTSVKPARQNLALGTPQGMVEAMHLDALLETGALQRAILRSANFSSIATDEKGVIKIFNIGAERMLGYTAADVIGKITLADISDPQEVIVRANTLSRELDTTIAPGFDALVFKAKRGIEDNYELTYVRKDGSRFPSIVSVSALHDTQRGIIGYLLIGTDNTIRKQAEAERQHMLKIQEATNIQLQQTNATLQVSEERHSVTLNSIGDAVITTDADARVTLLNPEAELLTGWTNAEAIGHPVSDVFNIINQDTRQPSPIPVMETLAHGTVQRLANHTIVLARNGRECAIANSCAPIRSRDGQVIGAVLVFRDVTKEYLAQQTLRDNSELIQTILNTVSDGLITINDHGEIEKANTAVELMFGYAASEVIGQKLNLLMPEPYHSEHDDYLNHYLTTGKARIIGIGREVSGQRKDGSVFPMDLAVNEMWLGGKRYFVGIVRDITVRKSLDQVLQEKNVELENAKSVAEKASLAKSEFLSSMSHELRTPLNAILGFAQLLESDNLQATPNQKECIDQILHAGWHLLNLISEILDLTKIESRELSLSEEPVCLSEVILECKAMVEPQAQERGIKISLPRFDNSQFVRADRTRLKQVLLNLLSNAIKYNAKQGQVEVTCTENTPGHIRVNIRDTGAGLDPEQLTQLFQPFNRLGHAAGIEEGTGIGLVVAKRLIELMGGTIGVESSVGVGSVFWFELVSIDEPHLAMEHGNAGVLPQPPVRRTERLHTLLYVENNPANLKLVEQIVSQHADIHLLTAVNGNSGIEIARASMPEVILMDINLHDINGFEVLRILRADPFTAHIPVIAISANAMPFDIERGLKAGFFRYITKPIKVDDFMNTLNVALAFAENGANKN